MQQVLTFLGCDVETTGLASNSQILEIALVAYDQQLEEIEAFQSLVLPRGDLDTTIASAEAPARAMHHASGLWQDLKMAEMKTRLSEVPRDYFAPQRVERRALDWVHSFAPPAKPAMLGSSVTFDRIILDRWMPTLHTAFSYKSVDATSFALVAGAKAHRLTPPTKSHHRALGDVRHSREIIDLALAQLRRKG